MPSGIKSAIILIFQRITEHGIPFQGQINLQNPDHSFHLLEYYSRDEKAQISQLEQVYFGRWVRKSVLNDWYIHGMKIAVLFRHPTHYEMSIGQSVHLYGFVRGYFFFSFCRHPTSTKLCLALTNFQEWLIFGMDFTHHAHGGGDFLCNVHFCSTLRKKMWKGVFHTLTPKILGQ